MNGLERVDSLKMENGSPEEIKEVLQSVARQDSGVPEDLASPENPANTTDEDPNNTTNSDCNITVIHITEFEKYKNEQLGIIAETKKDNYSNDNKDSKDGSDSGVEGCNTEALTARSRDSIDYGSSCGGLDEASCDSSLVSCCSVYEDPCATPPEEMTSKATPENVQEASGTINNVGGGPSEAGSESSSLAGSVSARENFSTPAKRASNCSTSSINKKKTSTSTTVPCTPRSRLRTATPRNIFGKTVSQTQIHTPSASQNQSQSQGVMQKSLNTRLRQRDKSVDSKNVMTSSIGPISRPRQSLLTAEITKDLAQRSTRTKPCTGVVKKTLVTPKISSQASKLETTPAKNTESKIIDAYATLPRRNRSKVAVKVNEKIERTGSRPVSRDTSLNRMVDSKKTIKDNTHKNLPPFPRHKHPEKTKIYHEVTIQTGLTGSDIDKALSGCLRAVIGPDVVEHLQKETQTERTWEDLHNMKANLKRLGEENSGRKLENERLRIELEEVKKLLKEEQADHAFARQELDRNAQRVLAMLGTPQSEHAEGSDSFLELETQIQSSGQVVADQQHEIADLQSLCRCLSRDLEKSLAAQKTLLQQQQEMEVEAAEMQDFLQQEKATLSDALKEAETEIRKLEEALSQNEQELERKTEECKHLVRISEQRRQENLSLNLKLNAVERRCRELLLTQGAAVSGAAVALSGLGTRLEALVDQLIVSYNISAKDLEDVIYHNEAYSRSNSSIDSSPVSSKHSLKECTASPKTGSFVSAVIGAIRNAATHPFASKTTDNKSIESTKLNSKAELSTESSSDILDFETEPCLMMESVLEDVPITDTYSHNMVSSCDSLRRAMSFPETTDESIIRKTRIGDECTSLTNLTQAILHRRKVEDEEDEDCESVSESDAGTSENRLPVNDYCPAVSLVDQVIDVDNLVTKLLKVLRIIQLDNDMCIQELKEDKSTLESKLDAALQEITELKKLTDGFRQSEEMMSNSDRRQSVMENCRLLIKEVIVDDIANKFL
ncbi:serine-rich adhesin for platelets [Prorops nasuta]|uniref:serine-rich adhesin for platelets n=1 Tax=Prorops nasuta TaxID=863751 RepID=UPI0034CE69E8